MGHWAIFVPSGILGLIHVILFSKLIISVQINWVTLVSKIGSHKISCPKWEHRSALCLVKYSCERLQWQDKNRQWDIFGLEDFANHLNALNGFCGQKIIWFFLSFFEVPVCFFDQALLICAWFPPLSLLGHCKGNYVKLGSHNLSCMQVLALWTTILSPLSSTGFCHYLLPSHVLPSHQKSFHFGLSYDRDLSKEKITIYITSESHIYR